MNITKEGYNGAEAKRVLLCGVGPLPVGNPDRLYATGLRLWGFARALVGAGRHVNLLEVEFGKGAARGAGGRLHRLKHDMSFDMPEALAQASPRDLLADALRRQPYDCIVATTDVMNAACAEACDATPLWCDFFGHPMAERQSQAFVHDSDAAIAAQWDYLLAPLLRADRLSGCSEQQRLALTGELGACGRLNRLTDGWPLAVSLPPALIFSDFHASRRVARGPLTPENAFIVLWSGGYNTWADTDTLFLGLEEAMRREPRLHYVSTGGAIAGHDERTFDKFRRRAEESPLRDRFHFAGWVETRDMANFYLEADVGVNCDRRTLEGELGTRNRVLDWAAARLGVITTNLCGLTQDLEQHDLIDTFEPGDSSGLAELFVRAAARAPEETRERADRARRYLKENYAPESLFDELVAWTGDPLRAPDLRHDATAGIVGVPFSVPDNALARRRAAEWFEARGKPNLPRCVQEGWRRLAKKFK